MYFGNTVQNASSFLALAFFCDRYLGSALSQHLTATPELNFVELRGYKENNIFFGLAAGTASQKNDLKNAPPPKDEWRGHFCKEYLWRWLFYAEKQGFDREQLGFDGG